MKSKTRHYLTQLVKIILAVGLIYWLWSSGKLDFNALRYFLAPQWALLGLALIGFNIFVCSERWRLLLQTQNRAGGMWAAFKLSLIGIFFNYAMPGGVGGDVVKAYYFQKDHPGSRVVAVTSVFIDRALGLYAMLLMALVVMVYDGQHVFAIHELKNLFFAVVLVSLVATVGIYFLFSTRIHRTGKLQKFIALLPMSGKFQKLYDSFYMYGQSTRIVFKVILYSWIAQVVSVFYILLAGELTDSSVPYSTYFLVAPLGFIATGLPLTPAGVGVGQAAFYFLFNVYLGRVSTIGSTTITAFQVGQLVWGLVGAIIYLRRHQPMHKGFEAGADAKDNEYAPSR